MAYSFTVAGLHTYHVSANDVLAHNAGGDSPVGEVFRDGSYRFQIFSNDHAPTCGHLQGPGIKGMIDEAKQIYEMFTDGREAYATGRLAAMILKKVVTKGAGGAAALVIKKAGCSFESDTEVLMADGLTEPIESIEVGDEVLATDPETGEQEAKAVEAKHVHDDILVALVLVGARGMEGTIRTAEGHRFWSETDQEFQRADSLSSGSVPRSAMPRRQVGHATLLR